MHARGHGVGGAREGGAPRLSQDLPDVKESLIGSCAEKKVGSEEN